MSLSALAIIAKENDKEVTIGFTPVLNKAGRTSKFVAPLATIDGHEGSASAKDLRLFYKSQGITGRKLTEKVNEAMRSGKTVRQAKMQLFLSAASENGFVPDCIEANAKGTAFNVRLVSAKEKVKSDSVKLKAAKAERDDLSKENQSLKEQMAKMMAAMEAAGITV